MKKNVAYITSGKVGIHRFTFNELYLLEEKGIGFILCLTQLNEGPCMPMKNWSVITAARFKALSQFFKLFVSKKHIISMLLESKRLKVVPYFFMALSFYYDLKKNNITSIHCQMGDDKLYIGYFLKKLLNKPLTVTVHAHELYKRGVYDENDKIKKLYSFCDKVFTISNFNTHIIKDKFHVEDNKLEVMRLFPEIDHLNYVKDKTKILIVATWVEKKGYDTLLRAIKEIKRKDLVLWVVGGANLSHGAIDVNELVKKYELEDQVSILGRQSSPILDILFYACDIFCLPSYTDYYDDGNPSEREGIPVALMEAMAWGKPVIATRHSGNPELVSNILVEEKDMNGLVNAITYLLDNPDKWSEMGMSNQKIIEDKFSKNNIEKLINTFNNL